MSRPPEGLGPISGNRMSGNLVSGSVPPMSEREAREHVHLWDHRTYPDGSTAWACKMCGHHQLVPPKNPETEDQVRARFEAARQELVAMRASLDD